MKRLIAFLLAICMLCVMAACAPSETPEQILERQKQEYAEFRQTLAWKDVEAVNARVEVLDDGTRMLMTDVVNHSETDDVASFVLSFACWDKDGNFVIIKTQGNPENTYSIYESTDTEIEIKAGETWVADAGFKLAEACPEIAYVEAIVVSYKTATATVEHETEYNEWQNRYIDQPLDGWVMELMDAEQADGAADADPTDDTATADTAQ